MSCYTYFYIRSKEHHEYVSLGSYGRSCRISQIVSDDAPYEKIRKATPDMIDGWITSLRSEIETYEETNKKYEKNITEIKEYNNSVSEKLDEINQLKDLINDNNDSIAEYRGDLELTFLLYRISLEEGQEIYFGQEVIDPKDELIVEET